MSEVSRHIMKPDIMKPDGAPACWGGIMVLPLCALLGARLSALRSGRGSSRAWEMGCGLGLGVGAVRPAQRTRAAGAAGTARAPGATVTPGG